MERDKFKSEWNVFPLTRQPTIRGLCKIAYNLLCRCDKTGIKCMASGSIWGRSVL